MTRASKMVSLVVLLAWTTLALAERPPQTKKDATDVVSGTVVKITPTEKKFGDDGVVTSYIAEVKLDKVDKGDLKAGGTIDIHWFHVTKRPTKAFPGAYGHKYDLKPKEAIRAYLIKGSGNDARYEVIYNSDGVEKLEKADK